VGFDFFVFLVFCLRRGAMAPARRGRFGFLCLREAVFCCTLCLVYLPLRWHPRDGVCRSSVAPVRGGTYFSLPPQRKVGKRKRLTPLVLVPA
jgi:hypothetical protein